MTAENYWLVVQSARPLVALLAAGVIVTFVLWLWRQSRWARGRRQRFIGWLGELAEVVTVGSALELIMLGLVMLAIGLLWLASHRFGWW